MLATAPKIRARLPMAAAKHNDFPEVDHAAQERVADASTVARLVTFLQNAWYPKETQHAMRVDKKDTRVLSAPQGSRKRFRATRSTTTDVLPAI